MKKNLMKILLAVLMFAVYPTLYGQVPSFLWAEGASGTNYDEGRSVTTDANGNVFVTGYFQSESITFGSATLINGGGFDYFVVKYDSNGNMLWAKGSGGANDDVGNDITTDAEGNVYVTGYFYSSSISFGDSVLENTASGSNDVFVVKYSSTGDVLWAKKEGGPYYDYGKSIATDANGNVFVTGNFSSSSISLGSAELTNTSMFGWDIFMVKYNSNGDVEWANGAGGSGGEYVSDICADDDGNTCVTGYFYSPSIAFGMTTVPNEGEANVNSDIFVVKYDANGDLLWARGEGGASFDVGNSVAIDADENVLVAGAFKGPTFTFANSTLSNAGNESYDLFVLKYDSSGNELWVQDAGGSGSEYANSISSNAEGEVYITGYFYSPSLSLNTTTLINASASGNHSDLYVVKYDGNGNELWATSAGGLNNEVGFGIAADSNGDVLLTGHFHSQAISFGTTELSSEGGAVFVAKLSELSTDIPEMTSTLKINVFPNPASTSAILQASRNLNSASLTVFDSYGRVVEKIEGISQQRIPLPLDRLSAGVYFIQLNEGDQRFVRSLMVSRR